MENRNEIKLETRCVSSLAKIFAEDTELLEPAYKKGSALWGEAYAFQVAFRSDRLLKHIQVQAKTALPNSSISVRSVGLAPSELPIYEDHDSRIFQSKPGLFPDPLFPVKADEGISALPNVWRSVWITVEVERADQGGTYPIEVRFTSAGGEAIGSETFELTVIPRELPEQKLIHTEWFHSDCIATYYNVPVFSEEHWDLLEAYIKTAVKHGINMLLTPLFTPPLDTAVGGERPTVQLVDVEKTGDRYAFGFDKLDRWADLCLAAGIRYFEFSHLYTQWGAKHAPKIMAAENGTHKRIFGWETEAAGEAYRSFLGQFVPELLKWVEKRGLQQKVYFHISDEPYMNTLENYRLASDFLRPMLKGYPVIDALSDFAFYESGLVPRPIPATNHIEPFLEAGVADLWTYYCCGQYKDVANRFFTFPSARNRIIGVQLHKFGITGFLHWGFNFWFSQYSRKAIDPFVTTDAGHAFPSGDAFLVYPGEEGPIESIRMEVFYEALQDMRAFALLEELGGKEELRTLMDGITFSSYPEESEWLLALRETVNQRIAAFTE
ncbi:DUF4091 domain-containing protein [Paenibacillus montanisoli]|uniref:Glycoside hydrolase 123 catalytic domain-containing protein n=1 Tax=Paenibacillus montanisoli TaxID=2081970 RepID=A0A328TX86_9BACL|nr:DUF4091 domain-containing protein [Paenibacillus montanisoli]RAP74173.1 hypothetical protein DL346_24210 [Paenibacillus montanisoli]